MGNITSTHRDWREGRRLRAWDLKQQGWKQCDIAHTLGVTEGAVSQWVRRGQRDGTKALRCQPSTGGSLKLNPAQNLDLLEMLSFGAETFGFRDNAWTGLRVAALIQHFLGVTYHPGHVNRLLKQWGWSSHKSSRQTRQFDEEVIAHWSAWTWPHLKKTLLQRN